jgi:hypothetical protein
MQTAILTGRNGSKHPGALHAQQQHHDDRLKVARNA